jgi:hypothetical protein
MDSKLVVKHPLENGNEIRFWANVCLQNLSVLQDAEEIL